MDEAAKTMIENLHKNTGKSLEEWVKILAAEKLEKHGQMIKFLKEKHSFTHGFANLVAHKLRASDSGSAENPNDLVVAQYKGKEHFVALYESLASAVQAFGEDVELVPKKTYVSLRRKKQFGCLNPATKSRYEVGINLKGFEPEGILEKSKNSMFTHRINLTSNEDDLSATLDWLKKAYESAG